MHPQWTSWACSWSVQLLTTGHLPVIMLSKKKIIIIRIRFPNTTTCVGFFRNSNIPWSNVFPEGHPVDWLQLQSSSDQSLFLWEVHYPVCQKQCVFVGWQMKVGFFLFLLQNEKKFKCYRFERLYLLILFRENVTPTYFYFWATLTP